MSELSKYEINKAIAVLVYPTAMVSKGRDETEIFFQNPNHLEGKWVGHLDYCNNWNDLMPLVVEYLSAKKIQYCFEKYRTAPLDLDGIIVTEVFDDLIKVENPQIALAECLLLVLEEKAKGNINKLGRDDKVQYSCTKD